MGKKYILHIDTHEHLLREKLSKFAGRPLNDETNDELHKEIREWLDEVVRSLTFVDEGESTMNFGDAIKALKQGKRVARTGWNGKGMWLALQRPDENSKMTLPYVYIEYPKGHPAYPDGSRVPWLASQTDMLSDDWVIVE